MHVPKPTHFEDVYKILRYLKGTPGKVLYLKTKSTTLPYRNLYGCKLGRKAMDRRSTYGYFFFVGGNLVTWKMYILYFFQT